MSTTEFTPTALPTSRRIGFTWLSRRTRLGVSPATLILGGILLLAAFVRFSNLSALGYANHYYAAAIKSMLQSWHNFFFVAAEPGASVTVDKPPLGLWIQAASALIFGINSFGLLFPQILAGILSILVLYHLVNRSYGPGPALLAALTLTITPVVVATDRNNTIDSTLIFTLLLAAWAFIKAAETARLRYLLLGAFLVGLGFNIKMLEAYLPLPAFLALYFFGARESIFKKLGKLSLASTVLIVISFSWATIVDLTPANQRPYIGSSGNNSEYSLIFGYNGVERLLGMFGRRPRPPLQIPPVGGFNGQNFNQNRNPNGFNFGNGFNPRNGLPGFPNDGNSPIFRGGFQGNPPGGFGGGFGGETGTPGIQRLFVPPLSKEASWLLPIGLAGLLLVGLRTHLTWPLQSKHQALVLWGGWLFAAGIFFSVAGFFHQYYLSTLAPPLAALVGLAAFEAWAIYTDHPWLTLLAIAIVVSLTLLLQQRTALAFVTSLPWQPVVVGLLIAGLLAFLAANFSRQAYSAIAGFACVFAALLVTPGVWSWLTVTSSSENQSLPAAYDGRSRGPVNRGSLTINQALLSYLQPRTQNMEYLMAVPSSMQGSDYVLATGRPVLFVGGFMGQDQVVTTTDLSDLVSEGRLRFIYWDAGGRGFGQAGQSGISSWLSTNCKAVPGFDTASRNSGAPDGTGNGITGPSPFFRAEMQMTLYDCGAAAH